MNFVIFIDIFNDKFLNLKKIIFEIPKIELIIEWINEWIHVKHLTQAFKKCTHDL